MYRSFFAALAYATRTTALIRFGCSQLVIDRLDPLVEPGNNPSAHLHQIIGGNSFQANMSHGSHDLPVLSTCTTFQPADDFSNYWTASLYFRARNGTYKRVPQKPNAYFEEQNGGMTVYYMQDSLFDFEQPSKVTAFQPGFRMLVGSSTASTKEEADNYRQLTYTCLDTIMTRGNETKGFPDRICPAGIMVNLRFPTCWDGINLDSPDHMSHMSYPENGTFEQAAPCPESHPVRVPQLFYEVIYDTSPFNDPELWPENGGQPFVYSFGDSTGFANHGDYIFGWKDDSLQKIMDEPCFVNCTSMRTQTFAETNACTVERKVVEDIGDDDWLTALPGQHTNGR